MFKSVGGTLPITAHNLQGNWQEDQLSWDNQPLYNPSEISQASVDTNAGYKTWDVTSAVKGWVPAASGNNGLALVSINESYFWSKEFYSSDAENGLRPKLVVKYAMLKNGPDVTGTEVTIADFKDEELRLQWTPVPYSLYYEVYRADNPGGPYAMLGTTWSVSTGGNGSLDTFFYDDVDGGYPEPPITISTDRASQAGTIRVQWNAPSDPAPSATYYYRIKALGIENKQSGFTNYVPGQLTPTISKYFVYNSTSFAGPWSKMLGVTADTSYTHSGLGQGKLMYYRLKSESSEGYQSILSKIVSGRSNRAPTISNPYISPSTAYTTNYLYARYTFSDADGDTEQGSQIRWYRDGKLFTSYNDKSFIYPSSTKKGEVWYFTVNPKDGIEFGTVKTSGMITIKNSVPKLSKVKILPNSPKTTDTLSLSYTYADADKDPETGTEIKWYLNGLHQTSYDGATSIPMSTTVKGDVWKVSVRTSDGTEYCAWIESPSVKILNTLPVATDVKITPLDPTTNDVLNAVYTYTDADKDTESGTKIYWYKNDLYQSAYANKLTVPPSGTSKGEQWYYTVTPGDGEQYGSMVTSPLVKIGNAAPVILDLKIYPEGARTGDDLTVWYKYSDPDGDAEQGSEIRWYQNDRYVNSLDNQITVPSSLTIRGESWQFTILTILPKDGFNFGITYYSDTIVIANTAPEILSAKIEPEHPAITDSLMVSYEYEDVDSDIIGEYHIKWYKNSKELNELEDLLEVPPEYTNPGEVWYYEFQVRDTTDDLTANYDFSDLDKDSEDGSLINWYRNGDVVDALADSLTVPSKLTTKGDEWLFTITPADGKDTGTFYVSPSVVIANSAPVVSELAITPSEPSSNVELIATYTYFDADADPELGSVISWYKNQDLVDELNGKTTVPSDMLSDNDIWYFTVVPSDGDDFGKLEKSSEVNIGKASVVIDRAWIQPVRPTTTDDLEANVEIIDDSNTQNIVFEYQWYKDSTLQSKLYDKGTVGSSLTSKDDIWYFTVRIYDGRSWSALIKSEPVTILNTPPEVQDLSLLPKRPIASSDLKLDYEYLDIDRDLESGTEIQWYRNNELVVELNGEIVVPNEHLQNGDTWYCTVIPKDGLDIGQSATAESVTINSMPVVTNIILRPAEPTVLDGLVISYDYFDEDNDPETQTLISWYRNDEYMQAFDGWTTVHPDYTEVGDHWYAVVQPHDGYEYGPEYRSSEVTITDGGAEGTPGGTDIVDKSTEGSSQILWLILIIVVIVIFVIALLMIRRSKLLRSTTKETPDQILTIADARLYTEGREAKGDGRGGEGRDGYVIDPAFYQDDSLEVSEFESRAVGEEYVMALEEEDPCRDCEGDMDGDIERCMSCQGEFEELKV
jgi:hypothetical protein